MKTLAYIRVSTDTQDIAHQRLEILEYARKHDLKVTDFIELEISSRRSTADRRIDELADRLQAGDTLIVSELSRLGRSLVEVVALVNELVERKIRLIAIKQNLDLKGDHDMASKVVVTVFSLLAELERDLISARTKAALRALKAGGKVLGRKRGSIGKSKLDEKVEEIKILLGKGVPKSSIAKVLGVKRDNLYKYIRTRKLDP